MSSDVESSVLRGRPFGSVMILVNKKLYKCTQIVCSDDRYVIVIVGSLLIINVYLPCAGSPNRLCIYEDVI